MKKRSAEETKTEIMSFKVTANQKKTIKEQAKRLVQIQANIFVRRFFTKGISSRKQ